jgi:uncharacterized phage protein (TIGR02216 family)
VDARDRKGVHARLRRAKPGHDGKTIPFPWNEAIGFGLGVLRLSPDHFWRMTPRELALAIEAVTGRSSEPLGRAAFATLMTRFPDGR